MRELLFTFFKIGAFTFGGGYAMLPLIKKEIVEDKKWLTNEQLLDIIAIAESTPGPFAINVATFVGSKINKIRGALVATFGVVLPSFATVFLLTFVLKKIENNEYIQNAFMGIRAGVLVLIISAVISLYKQLKKSFFSYAIIIIVGIMSWMLGIDSITILLFCAFLGIIWCLYHEKRYKK